MDDTTVDEWMSFFRDAGIPPNVTASYASNFCQNRIHLNMVLELNRDLLKELGVTLIGDAIAILRHAKSYHEQNVSQKILNSMSTESQKPPEFSKKLIPTKDVASPTTNCRGFHGVIRSGAASTRDNSRLGITVASRNGNSQTVLKTRRQSQLTPKKYSLQRYGISTGRSVTDSLSQTDNSVQNNIPGGTLQGEELQLCETSTPGLGEAHTTEDINAPYRASGSQNNLRTSHSEHFVMRRPTESSSTLPLRQSSVRFYVSGRNYMCRRNQGLKRPIQQSPYTSVASASQQPAEKLLNGMPCTPPACQSQIPSTENNTLQDSSDEILSTLNIKRKRTSSSYGPYEQEQFHPSVCMQSVGTGAGGQSVYETHSTAETIHSEGSQVQEFSQLDVGLLRHDVKNEVIITEDLTEDYPSFEPQCQPPLQSRQEGSPVQICTHVQSQNRMQMPQSLVDKQQKSQILLDSQLSSGVASPSQLPLQRLPQSHFQYRPALNLCPESQSSLFLQPSVQPQSLNAVSFQANTHKDQQLQNQKLMVQCNPDKSCPTAKLILAGGKKVKTKFKLLHSRPRTSCTNSVPQLLQSFECPPGNEVQRPASTFVKENENGEKEELDQTMLESSNATCASQNESQPEFIGAGDDFLEEECQCLTDLNRERSAVILAAPRWSKPGAHTSDSPLCDDSSSCSLDGVIMTSGEPAKNNLQLERVPGQVFSRLGVKVKWVSLDNKVCSAGIKNEALPISRVGSNIKYKINKQKKHKNLLNKFAKTVAVKQLHRNKFLKRRIVFKTFQKTSPTDRQNIASDQTPQDAATIADRQPKLQGILKPHTITSKQQEDMEPLDEAQSQKMTANLLLESVAGSSATDDVIFEGSTLSNDSTKVEGGDYICQIANNFRNNAEEQMQLSTASSNRICKTVRFGSVSVKEFQQNVPPSSSKTAANFRPPIFSRLGTWRKGI